MPSIRGDEHHRCLLSYSSLKNAEKVTKINLRIISKPHAYLQTMIKTPVKFQKDRHKTVRRVSHIINPLQLMDGLIQGRLWTMLYTLPPFYEWQGHNQVAVWPGSVNNFKKIGICLCWGLTSQSTIFQSCWDGATASWVINQYFRGVKCLAQGHNTAAVGLEHPTSRSGVRHSITEPPRSQKKKKDWHKCAHNVLTIYTLL